MPAKEATYRPLSSRRRLFVLLLAVGTAVGIVLLLVGEPGGARLGRQQASASAPAPTTAPGPAVCADGQGSGCVGGLARVIAPAASR